MITVDDSIVTISTLHLLQQGCNSTKYDVIGRISRISSWSDTISPFHILIEINGVAHAKVNMAVLLAFGLLSLKGRPLNFFFPP